MAEGLHRLRRPLPFMIRDENDRLRASQPNHLLGFCGGRMSEAMWVALIGAVATIVAAWIASRKQSPPVGPRADSSHAAQQRPAGAAQPSGKLIPVPSSAVSGRTPSGAPTIP